MMQFKSLSQTQVGKFFAVTFFTVAALFAVFSLPNSASAATCTAGTGGGGSWNTVATWSGGAGNCNHVPLATDAVVIPNTNGLNVTVDTTAVALSVTFTGGNRANAVTISGTNSLTVTNAITINAPTGAVTKQVAVGAGTLTAGSISITSGSSGTRISQVTLSTGTINVSGNITFGGTVSSAKLVFSGAGTLNIGGANGIGASGTFTASTGTVNYNAAIAQSVGAYAYNNLIFSGGGAKAMSAGTSVAGNLSIAPAGGATANIASGQNLSVGTLTLGGFGRANGTWGSTTSGATNKDNTYFAATTGILTVATDTRLAQATLIAAATPSAITYGSTSTLSTTGGSGTGAVTFSVGASTGCSISATTTLSVTNANGTCSVTATKAGDATYQPATSAPISITLSKKDLTVTGIIANDKPYDGNTTATLNVASAALVGVVSGDVITLNTGSAVGTFATSSIGSGIVVTISGLTITGAQSANYNLIQPTTTASITSGPPVRFLVAGPASAYAKTRAGFTISRKDVLGNPSILGTSTVYLYTNSSSINAKFYNDSLVGSVVTSIQIPNGQSSVGVWYYDDTAGTYTITGSDATPVPDGATGIIDGTATITILPVAVKFVILQPADGSVDAAIPVTVQAQKPDNSVDLNYQLDVTLNLSGHATTTGVGLIDIINGVGTKNISDTFPESVTISLSDTQATGLDVTSSKQVNFSAGALAQFTLNHPGSIGAGTRAAYTVTRKDQYGNLITAGTSTIYLYTNSSSSQARFYADAISTSTPITSVTIGAGASSANLWYYDQMLGNWTIVASDNATAPDYIAGVNDAVDSLTVVPGAVAVFTLNHSAPISVGTRAAYTVTRYDGFNNLVTAGATNVYLYSSSVSTSSAFYLGASGGSPTTLATINAPASTANFWYEDGVAGTYTITASDKATAPPDGNIGIIDGTDSLTVTPAPIVATRFVILDPGAATVDAGVTVRVQAQDNAGSVATTYSGIVNLNVTGLAQGAGAVNVQNGEGTKVITDTMAQTVSLTLADAGAGLDVSSSKTLTFAPGALAQFSITSPGDMAAGTRQALTVARKDQFGNGVTSGLTVGYLYSASTNANKRFYDSASGGGSITFVNFIAGVSSTQVWYYDETAATTTATISDNATSPDGNIGIADGSTFVHVVPGAVAKFTLTNPGNMFVGTRLGYTAGRQDAYGNDVYSGITLARLYSSSSGANKKFYDSGTLGNVVTSVPIDDGKTSANFWYYDESAGTWNITVSDGVGAPDGNTGIIDAVRSVTVSLVPIVATKFVITPPGGPFQVGTPVLVAIQAEDNSGNVQTDYNNSVTLNVTGSATGGGVVSITNGTGVASVNDLTEETVTLTLTDSNHTGFNTSSTQTIIYQSAPVLGPGFAGGGTPAAPAAPVIGGITFAGRAYPGANLSVIALGEGATILRQATVASGSGIFQVDFRDIPVGAASYGLLVQDPEGRVSQTKTYDVNLKNKSDILQVANILVSPTLGFSRPTVTKGDRLIAVGYSTPGSTIKFKVDGKNIVETATAGSDGAYRALLRTGEMSLGSHTLSAMQIDVMGRSSDASPTKVFNVSSLLVPQVDFNTDGKIDVKDASIFLSRFNSTDPKVKLLDDLNGDGKVDASDLSIFIRTLRLK